MRRIATAGRHAAGLLALLLTMLVFPVAAQALDLVQATPQGSARDVRQVVLRFDAAVAPFGDAQAPAPASVDCAEGQGHWTDARTWVFDFRQALPAGLRCAVRIDPALVAVGGARYAGPVAVSFDTGGPVVRASLPSDGDRGIDEDTVFWLRLDAPVSADSVRDHAYCAVANLAEKLPVQLIEPAEREAMLPEMRRLGWRWDWLLFDDPDRERDAAARGAAEQGLLALRCARPLPADADVDLVWDAGIAAPAGAGEKPVTLSVAQRLAFHTRPSFTARIECERVNAEADCIPVKPITVRFSAQVPREALGDVALVVAGREQAPELDDGPLLDSLQFRPPFPPAAELELRLPEGLRDDAGRALANADRFPLALRTDLAPPLAKFSGNFGILESSEGGVLPVTLRRVEADLPARELGGQWQRSRDLSDVWRWMQRVQSFGSPEWDEAGKPILPGSRSVFDGETGATDFRVPNAGSVDDAEVIGIPLGEPGFYVVELASPALGAALLGDDRTRYVATTALVTDMAVHFKWGREGSLVMVTSLSGGKPLSGVAIEIADACSGERLWQGSTDAAGLARPPGDALPEPQAWGSCDYGQAPLIVAATLGEDFSFALSTWNDGIRPWDFQIPEGAWQGPQIAHTVLDRSLLRPGETVSMKHYWRRHTSRGFDLPETMPTTLVLQHEGSDTRVEQPLSFDPSGIAESRWTIPKTAPLGVWRIRYVSGEDVGQDAGAFRVQPYKLPTMQAVIDVPPEPQVAVDRVPVSLYLSYLGGGAASGLPVRVRSQREVRAPGFAGYESFSFAAEDLTPGTVRSQDEPDPVAPKPAATQPMVLDDAGAARLDLPVSGEGPGSLVVEFEYPDANGELASAVRRVPLWPAGLAVGVRTDGWAGRADRLDVQAVVLDLDGQPLANRRVRIEAYERRSHSYRQRLVGGYYAYSHARETRRREDLDCRARTGPLGRANCTLKPKLSGELVLRAVVEDDDGRLASATTSAWIVGEDDWWFEVGDSDRMDVVAETGAVEPGDSARLQVRMPFRSATALVSVEREGVLDAFIVELSGHEPVVEVPIKPEYAPNVYVSVLAVRPRVDGFRSRIADLLRLTHLDKLLKWAPDGGTPTATVDLSKPAFRLGQARVDVGQLAHRLDVQVIPERSVYPIRDIASVDVQVRLPDGSAPPVGSEIAFAAVDAGLLQLAANDSWDLLAAMSQPRGLEVLTSTAQMQVVGKRHFGRKALAAGGGGGRAEARQIVDSLLSWQPRVPLDASGHARLQVPINDALTEFRLVAVASSGLDRFGTGEATIRTQQDVQLFSGLPLVGRGGDRIDARFTVRNAGADAREIAVRLRAAAGQLPLLDERRSVQLGAGTSRELLFPVEVPVSAQAIDFDIEAVDAADGRSDHLAATLPVIDVEPVRVQQATLLQLDPATPTRIDVAAPDGALPDRGGLRIELSPSLAGSLDGVRDYMQRYAWACFEQETSRAVALDDDARWTALMERLPTYLDARGLLRFFPCECLDGSVALTAYVMTMADLRGWPIPADARARMLDALRNAAEGRSAAAASAAMDVELRLAAFAALARDGQADATAIASLMVDPGRLSTAALLDWIAILRRVDGLPDVEAQRRAAAVQLRTRFDVAGTRLTLDPGPGGGWPLLMSPDGAALRAVLQFVDQPDWADDLPLMMRAAIATQRRGHWDLTTANAWGTLAVNAFAAHFEQTPVAGDTRASLGATAVDRSWPEPEPIDLPWPLNGSGLLSLEHRGAGRPWAVLQSRAAVPRTAAFGTGYRIERRVSPVEQAIAGRLSRGDTVRVTLAVEAQAAADWVVVEDPVPAGARILGSGLGGESALLGQARNDGSLWPVWEERRPEAFRAYFERVPAGNFEVSYTLRYDGSGEFQLPPTRVEAMYAPERFAELPRDVEHIEDR